MKRWLLRGGIILGILVTALAALGLVAKSMAAGAGKERLVATLEKKLGVPLSVGPVEFDFASLFRLEPSLALTDIAVGNPPGFRGKNLLEAKRMSARAALWPLLHRRLEIRSLAIGSPKVIVEMGPKGSTNIEELLKKLSAQSTRSEPSSTEVAVSEFSIASGEITWEGADASPVKISAIQLRARDLAADQACRLELSGKLFGGRDSGFGMKATAGPFGKDSLPLNGTLMLTLAPAEIPAAIRKERFGDLFGAPGAKARAALEATVKGDLYRSIGGPAKLSLQSILIGRDASHQLPLSGDAQATFTVARPISNPAFRLEVPGGRLRLGDGEWSGSAELHMAGQSIAGSSKGSVRNVEINSLLGSLTTASDSIYGLLEVPSYTAKFAGKNAAEIRNSLSGTGKLNINQGRLAQLDMLASIEKALSGGQDTAGAKGTTAFRALDADLNIGGGRLDVPSIKLDSPALRFTGKGAIGFDQNMHFDLDTVVTGNVARMVNRLGRQSDGAEAVLPVTVAGAVSSPQVRPNVRKLATGVAQGLIDSFFQPKKK